MSFVTIDCGFVCVGFGIGWCLCVVFAGFVGWVWEVVGWLVWCSILCAAGFMTAVFSVGGLVVCVVGRVV